MRGTVRRESTPAGAARQIGAAVRVQAGSNPFRLKATARQPPRAPPAGTDADPTLFKAAGVALAIPTVPTFFSTRPALDAFHLTNDDPAAFTSLENIQHFSNLFGTDCFALIALCSLYVLADAAENNRLNSATYQRLAAAVTLYTAANALGVAVACAAPGSPSPSLAVRGVRRTPRVNGRDVSRAAHAV